MIIYNANYFLCDCITSPQRQGLDQISGYSMAMAD